MENELLEKSMADLRRARAVVNDVGEQANAQLAMGTKALEDAKFQMTMAIIMTGGVWLGIELGANRANGQYSREAVRVTSVARHFGDLRGAVRVVELSSVGNSEMRVLESALHSFDVQKIATALTKARYVLCQNAMIDCAKVAVGGHFFRLVGDKYEVMG